MFIWNWLSPSLPSPSHLCHYQQVDSFVRYNIAGALGALGDRSITSQLLGLLANEQVNSRVRNGIAGALGTLGERSIIPQLLGLLANKQVDSLVRRRIADTLGTLVTDEEVVHALAVLLFTSDVADNIHGTLWRLSRQIGVRIFLMNRPEGKQVEVVKLPS